MTIGESAHATVNQLRVCESDHDTTKEKRRL